MEVRMLEEEYIEKLRRLRASDVARDCGISRPTVYRILDGKKVSKPIATLIKMYLDRGL